MIKRGMSSLQSINESPVTAITYMQMQMQMHRASLPTPPQTKAGTANTIQYLGKAHTTTTRTQSQTQNITTHPYSA
jgi:hypothetical protein